MNLKKKKKLIVRMFGVGTERVFLDSSRAREIKEAITRQDMRELLNDGTIKISEQKGRRKKEKRKTKKLSGKRKKRVKKKEYVKVTRKLRKYLSEQKKKGKMTRNEYRSLRNKIKARVFKSLGHFKEALKS